MEGHINEAQVEVDIGSDRGKGPVLEGAHLHWGLYPRPACLRSQGWRRRGVRGSQRGGQGSDVQGLGLQPGLWPFLEKHREVF